MNPALFFRAALLTPEGVAALRRLNGARIERFAGNLPQEAYAVYRVWESPMGVGVEISYSGPKSRYVPESYLLEGLRLALDTPDEPLARARELEQEYVEHLRNLGRTSE